MSAENVDSIMPSDFLSNLQKGYQETYAKDQVWRECMESCEKSILESKPDLAVTAPFIFYLFGKPEIAIQFPVASYLTLEATRKAQITQDSSQVHEAIFFVDEGHGRIRATDCEEHFAAFDLRIPSFVTTKENSENQTLALVHTHPPLWDVLKPSVYIKDQSGKEFGDLFAFTKLHEQRADSLKKGSRPSSIARPLSIIMQSDLEKGTERFLFILETPEVAANSQSDYVGHLKKNKDRIDTATSDEDVVQALRDMGYYASRIAITTGELYGEFPVIGEQLQKLTNDLGLLPPDDSLLE